MYQRHGRMVFVAFLLLGAASAGCRQHLRPAPLPRVLEVMQKRLELMHAVARWKWTEKKPISDPERERESLAKLVERGRKKGLDPEWVHAFFTAQMAAARRVQQDDFDRWQAEKQGAFGDAVPLAVLRQGIDHINEELLDLLVDLRPALPASEESLARAAERWLVGEGIEAVRETAIAPLRQGMR